MAKSVNADVYEGEIKDQKVKITERPVGRDGKLYREIVCFMNGQLCYTLSVPSDYSYEGDYRGPGQRLVENHGGKQTQFYQQDHQQAQLTGV